MGRPTIGFGKYYNSDEQIVDGNTTKYPCKFCKTARANNSRDQASHLAKCKKIPQHLKDEIQSKLDQCQSIKPKSKKKKMVKQNIVRRQSLFTPSKSTARLMSRMDLNESEDSENEDTDIIETSFTDNKSNTNINTNNYQSQAQQPPQKRRRLSSTAPTAISNYFRPKMNDLTFRIAATGTLRWLLSTKGFHPNDLNNLFCIWTGKLCEEFGNKFTNLPIIQTIDIFENNLRKKVYDVIVNQYGFIGIHFYNDDEILGIFVILDNEAYFLGTISVADFIAIPDEDTSNMELESKCNQLDTHPLTKHINKLKKSNLFIIGLKLNEKMHENQKLMDAVHKLVHLNGITVIDNMVHSLNYAVEKLFWIDDLKQIYDKIIPILSYIKSKPDIHNKLELQFGAPVPRDNEILAVLEFVGCVFGELKKLVLNCIDMDSVLRRNILVDGGEFITDIIDLKQCLNKLYMFIQNIKNDSSITLSQIYFEYKQLIKYYKENHFRLYLQDRYIRIKLKGRIIESINDMIQPRNKKSDPIFTQRGIMYALSNILDITLEKSTNPFKIITDCRAVMKSMLSISEFAIFNGLLQKVITRRDPFDQITSYDDLMGTNLYPFAEFALQLSTASGAPLEMLTGAETHLPNAYNIFVYLNAKCDKLFSPGESLMTKSKK